MKTVNTFPRLFAGLLFSLYALSANPDGEAARLTGGLENQPVPPAQGSEDPAANGKILVEIFLAPDRRDDLDRLSDPALTTSQFHALYRQLTGEDKRLPTYLK